MLLARRNALRNDDLAPLHRLGKRILHPHVPGSPHSPELLLAICALINTGFVYMGPETGVASFLLLSILGLVPLLIRSTHGEFVRLLNVQRDAKSQDSTVFHSFFSVALGPFVGFLLFALTMAVRKIAVFGNMYAESIGTISPSSRFCLYA